MGCTSTNTISITPKLITKENIQSILFKKINFEDIKIHELEFITKNQLILYNKDEGYKELIKETFRTLNNSMKGIFSNEVLKEKYIIKMIYYFFNTGLSNKIDSNKEVFITDYFRENEKNILNLHYSIISIPKIITYIFSQSLIPLLLPNGENDLKYFFGGQMKREKYNNFTGTNSFGFVRKRLLEINKNWNILKIELTLKNELMNEEEELILKDLINLEIIKKDKIDIITKEEDKEKILVNEFYMKKVIKIVLKYFSPYYLYDLLNENKLNFIDEKR